MKIYNFIFLFFISFSLFAQSPISKGTITLNGNLYFSSQSYDNSNSSQSILSLNPQFGYFVIDNLSLNLSFDYKRTSTDGTNTSYGFGPNIRYYFNMENYFPFLSLGYSFTKNIYSENDNELSGNQIILGAGITYMITKNVALETLLSYRFDNQKSHLSFPEIDYNMESDIDSKIIMIGVGINFFIY